MWPSPTTLLAPTPIPPIIPERYSAASITTNTRWRHQAYSASSQDGSGLGQAVLTALKSNPVTNNPGSNPNLKKVIKQKVKNEEPKRAEKEEIQKELSGSDILRALQKASVQKAKVSSQKKQQQIRKDGLADSFKKRENVNLNRVDYDKVRPITVKSDWATRLDNLEKRLQDFLSI